MISRILVDEYSNGNTWENLRYFPVGDSRLLLIGY
jgi:hypothetical protein